MRYRIVLVGGGWRDGTEHEIGALVEFVTPEVAPFNWLYEPTDPLPRFMTRRWRPMLAADGRPSVDDQGRYRYECTD